MRSDPTCSDRPQINRVSLRYAGIVAALISVGLATPAIAQDKKPNIVMLMTMTSGGAISVHIQEAARRLVTRPPRSIACQGRRDVHQLVWTVECTAGRSSFITGRIPIRSALSLLSLPATKRLKKETPTIAEFFKKNGYQPISRASGI